MGILCCRSKRQTASMDLLSTLGRNVEDHHTSQYSYDGLVVRRGFPFTITLFGCGESNKYSMTHLILETGDRYRQKLFLEARQDTEGWVYCSLSEATDDCYRVKLSPPSTAAVGQYLVTAFNYKTKIGSASFFLIFNPWCRDDDVYMESCDKREEYLLNDFTKLYMGTDNFVSSKDWHLDQFSSEAVKATIYMLNQMPFNDRKSVVKVSRAMSALINSNDDNGVVVGNWSGKYSEGVAPTSWIGSGEILSRYVSSFTPVRFGQCWVFSGVLCTVLRTIGIATRCITNYASLHDTDGSLKWEIFLDESLNVINCGGDSCWNFHCWNESWMRRRDLDPCHDGWQVLDATPQERSQGLFRLGPASKYAILRGYTDLPYDVGFVYAEVNADKIYFKKQLDGSFKEYMVKRNELGKSISTKRVGSDEREDITHEYKSCDSASPSRVPSSEICAARTREDSRVRNIKIRFVLPASICIGQDFTGFANITGMTCMGPTKIKSEISLVTYAGKNICKLYDNTETSDCCEEMVRFNVSKEQLSSIVTVEFPFIRTKVSVFDDNNDEYAVEEHIVPVNTPDIEIIGLEKAYFIGTPIKFKVYMKNHLLKPLTDSYLIVKFTDSKQECLKIGVLQPGQVFTREVELVSKTIGTKKVYVSHVSNECSGFTSTAQFSVIY